MSCFRRSSSRSRLLLSCVLSLLLGLHGLAAAAWSVLGHHHTHEHAAFPDSDHGEHLGSTSIDHDHHHSNVERHFHAPDDASVVLAEGSVPDGVLDHHDDVTPMAVFLALMPSLAALKPITSTQQGPAGPLWTCTCRTLVRLDRPPNPRA